VWLLKSIDEEKLALMEKAETKANRENHSAVGAMLFWVITFLTVRFFPQRLLWRRNFGYEIAAFWANRQAVLRNDHVGTTYLSRLLPNLAILFGGHVARATVRWIERETLSATS